MTPTDVVSAGGPRKSELSQHVVAMFDVMGQTDQLLAVGNPLDEGCDTSGIRDKWDQAKAPVVSLQSTLKMALSALSKADGGFVGIDLRLVWQAFGDSVVVSVPYRESAARFSDTCGLLLTCGAALLAGLAARVPFQCALELGLVSTDLLPGQVYGPALAEAYVLLEKHARFPRVIVGQRLSRVLRDAAGRQIEGAAHDADKWAEAASNSLRVLSQDETGLHFVDYLARDFAGVLGEPAASHEDIRGVRAWAHAQEHRFRAEAKFAVACKYTELLRYFDDRGYRDD